MCAAVAGKQNYYLSMFSAEEQLAIRAISRNRHDTVAANQALLHYFRESNKNSFVVSSAGIAQKMRKYKFAALPAGGRNIYKLGA